RRGACDVDRRGGAGGRGGGAHEGLATYTFTGAKPGLGLCFPGRRESIPGGSGENIPVFDGPENTAPIQAPLRWLGWGASGRRESVPGGSGENIPVFDEMGNTATREGAQRRPGAGVSGKSECCARG